MRGTLNFKHEYIRYRSASHDLERFIAPEPSESSSRTKEMIQIAAMMNGCMNKAFLQVQASIHVRLFGPELHIHICMYVATYTNIKDM